MISARRVADKGDCAMARDILDGLTRAQKDLAFTTGGLADALQPPMMARQVAEIDRTCGRQEAARTQWQRLAGLDVNGSPLAVAIADDAREHLGSARTAEDRRRLEAALASATATLESGGTSNPGSLDTRAALLLTALGQAGEARQSFRRVFLYPDRNLSHAMARAAMNDLPPEREGQK